MHSTWMQPANCRHAHAFWKEILVSVSSRTVRLSFHIAKDWMQHFPQFQFLISDPGGCFVSNELREWASIRGIGLLTAPGEFHGIRADLENLIRVIKRLARKLADDRDWRSIQVRALAGTCTCHHDRSHYGVGRCIPRQDKLVLSGYRTETS